MNIQLEKMDLLDLYTNKYVLLRKLCEKTWNNMNDIPITNSEWSIISIVYGNQPSISEVSQQVDISRQATHKCIKTLKSKDLIEINNVENNKRDKCLKLTAYGEKCYFEYEALKEAIEKDIEDKIGTEKLIILKNLLKDDWI